MMAAITVQAANMPPTIAITNPPNGSVLAFPATFSIGAKASDTDGSVTKVLFLQGTTSLGNIKNSPHLVTVNNLTAGDYTFSAVASDNGGLHATNAITVHVVAPAPIALSGLERLSATSFQFSYSAVSGLRYVGAPLHCRRSPARSTPNRSARSRALARWRMPRGVRFERLASGRARSSAAIRFGL
jgi:hypothetical protein